MSHQHQLLSGTIPGSGKKQWQTPELVEIGKSIIEGGITGGLDASVYS